MKQLLLFLVAIAILACGTTLIGCSDDGDDNDRATTSGTLKFIANGEDFVRQGFTSKDGWAINFDHVYITLVDITAYQTDPPYDAHQGGEISGNTEIKLAGIHTIDLAEGADNAPPIFVGQTSNVETGRYNAISWTMDEANSGSPEGHSLQMIGTAEKDGELKDFTINIDAVCTYNCGEYVGDQRKGFVAENETSELEMTFHFDHLFGDGDLRLDDDLNTAAPGFEYFIDYLDGQMIEMDMAEMHLGHVGEGHCHCECE